MSEQTYRHAGPAWALLPFGMAVTLVTSIWLRYGGNWAEVDTTVLTRAMRATMLEGTIQPEEGVYLHGFNYPALGTFLATTTGLSMRTIQTTVMPWCYVGTALVAFVAFRAITGSGCRGAISALLLLIQGDFLFVNQRGSHEKITWTLTLMLVFALATSFRRQQFAYTAPLTMVFYLGGFALICTNAFFASSLITSFLLAFAGGVIAMRWFMRDRALRPFLRRFGYIFATMSVLSYLYIAYLFPPVRANLANLEGVADRVAALYLDVETSAETGATTGGTSGGTAAAASTFTTAAASPYSRVALAWTNPRVYFSLTALTWIMMILAAGAWFFNFVRFLRRGLRRDEVPLFLVWIFTGATAFQIIASVVADAAGSLGSNMQLRLFPAFAVFMVPLVVGTLQLPNRLARSRALMPLTAMAAIGFAYFSVTAYLKATNDPIVSNKWVFYSASEARLLDWGDRYLQGQRVWSEVDERLIVADVMLTDDGNVTRESNAAWTGGSYSNTIPYVVVSDITASRSVRTRAPVPITQDEDRIYDNGRAQIDHSVPASPYLP